MGSSRDIAIGPVAVVSLLLGSLLQEVIDPFKNPVEYRQLAFTATFFAGITQAALGILRYHILKCTSNKNITHKLLISLLLIFTLQNLKAHTLQKCTGVDFVFRLGFLIDFLSHAAIVGFMGGAAITIALQQLKGFLGIKHFTKKTDITSVMKSVISSAEHGVSALPFISFHLY